MARQSVQLSASARGRCPSFGLLCFLCAFVAAVFGAQDASADAPLPAIKTTQLAVPAAVLGVTNPYLVAAALKKPDIVAAGLVRPKARGFTFSKHLQKLYRRVEILAIYGVTLNQRKVAQEEKLNLRVQSRLGGGVLQLRYRR
ncbi:MAG: hypothetical protein JRJ10_06460 [Deltaproteobacteria bacterium]|nr:hypothetical protein [Deltaproteobacteria bacterium]MBW2405585.1 hypothetical protein [Deltaproteobacteria bacterium]